MPQTKTADPPATLDYVRRFFEARDCVRRGICLLNAGQYDSAAATFSMALSLNPGSEGLRPYLARCHVGNQDYMAAAEEMTKLIDEDPDDITARIRHALMLWKHGDCPAAIASLRNSVEHARDCAELHFHLGTLLAAGGEQVEAAMRFTQALSLDKRHTAAMVSLAMCHAADEEVGRALALLTRAQRLRPRDARIGHLLTMASKAVDRAATGVHSPAAMPPECDTDYDEFVTELSRLIETDADFIDAFISLPKSETDVTLRQLLAAAAEQSLRKYPERADLHYQNSRLLDEGGDAAGAIASLEHAVEIDEHHTPALIFLGKLYRRAGRRAEAVKRLESALRNGADYADVHVLLGDLHRDAGRTDRARDAYSRAIKINANYRVAQESLEALGA